MADAIRFSLNGRPVTVTGASTQTTLLDWLRANGTTGPKEGCAEGDCGACSLVMRDRDASGAPAWRSFCSCITVLPMIDGRELLTPEGLAEGGPHPVQAAMADRYGSQCGYCTPGFVMSMFEGYHRADTGEAHRVADQLCGNLCRCTGYRPIRDAMGDALQQRDPGDRFHLKLREPLPALPALTLHGRADERFDRPQTLDALLALRAEFPDAVLVAGATEVGVELNKKPREFPHLISTEAVAELHVVHSGKAVYRIGAAATLTAIEEKLGESLRPLGKMLAVFASRQIRNRATLAGNLVTASPIGDLAPVLLAYDASVVLASVRGRRMVLLEDFFLSYRKTAMAPDEVMVAVEIPRDPLPEVPYRRADSFKVSKRREMDISIVAGAFVVDLDPDRTITRARLAFGGVAATPVRAKATEAALLGRPFTVDGIRDALTVLADEFTPITDARGGAAYRRQLIPNLFEKFVSGDRSLSQDLPLDYVTTPRRSAPTPPARCATRAPSGTRPAPLATSTTTPSAGACSRSGRSPRRTPAPASCTETPRPRAPTPAWPRCCSRRTSPATTTWAPCARTRRCWPPRRSATTGTWWRWWSPTTSRPRAAPPRWWWSTTSRCPRCSGRRPPSRRTASTPRATASAGETRTRPRARSPPPERHLHHRRPGALLPGDPRRLRRARRRRRRRGALLHAAPVGGPGGGLPRAAPA
jgi:xanthine dehydrogenase small subunit